MLIIRSCVGVVSTMLLASLESGFMRDNLSTCARFYWVGIAGMVILLDQASKYAAVHGLDGDTPLRITSFFNLTLTYNAGAAFSFLSEAGGWQYGLLVGIALLASVLLVIWLLKTPPVRCVLVVALALILGGALGNLLDRLVYGYVIDFIQLHAYQWYWPTFNIADSAICIGAFVMFIGWR